MVSIRVVGLVEQISAIKAIGEAGKAVSGSLATFSSPLPYASFIETGRSSKPQVRRAGPARMFALGVAATLPRVAPLLLASIPRGAASVGQAKRAIRDLGLQEIRSRTPVRSGALRDSVQVLERPR